MRCHSLIKKTLGYMKRRSLACFILMIIKTLYYRLRLKRKAWVGGNVKIRHSANIKGLGNLELGPVDIHLEAMSAAARCQDAV